MSNLFLLKRKKLNSLQKLREPLNIKDEQIICPKCEESLGKHIWEKNLFVCPECGYHMPIAAIIRIEMIVEEGSFREISSNMKTKNPIAFPDYDRKISAYMKKTGLCDALVAGVGKIEGRKTAIACLDSRFMMGSMGTVVGEKLTRLIEYATHKNLPLLIFSASGGARMQEGLFSLMQMAKTSAAIARFKSAGGFFVSYLTHPTTGGVSASFASLGDLIIAEPEALIGFAGPRVIEQTIGQTLPEGFQRAEFLEEHGFVDKIVHRQNMKKTLALLLKMHRTEQPYGK